MIAVDGDRRVRGFGVSAFVREDLTAAYLARPHAQIGKRILRDPGRETITLDEPEIGRRNAGEGLDLVVLNQGFDVEGCGPREIHELTGTMIQAFFDVHRGFKLARIVNEGFDAYCIAVLEQARLGFTPTERRLLRAALSGAPDSTVGRELAISVAAVKARWRRQLERAEANDPELGRRLKALTREGTRGPQLRHIVIDYVRHHPSELTPYLPQLSRTSV